MYTPILEPETTFFFPPAFGFPSSIMLLPAPELVSVGSCARCFVFYLKSFLIGIFFSPFLVNSSHILPFLNFCPMFCIGFSDCVSAVSYLGIGTYVSKGWYKLMALYKYLLVMIIRASGETIQLIFTLIVPSMLVCLHYLIAEERALCMSTRELDSPANGCSLQT